LKVRGIKRAASDITQEAAWTKWGGTLSSRGRITYRFDERGSFGHLRDSRSSPLAKVAATP